MLPWSKQDEFLAAEYKERVVDDKLSGSICQVGPFTFQQVYEGGHMVPLDQPNNALAILKAFTLPEQKDKEHGDVTDDAAHQRLDKQVMKMKENLMGTMRFSSFFMTCFFGLEVASPKKTKKVKSK